MDDDELMNQFVREKAHETVASFDLERFFAEDGDFGAHMDTIAGYLDEVVIPSLVSDCESRTGSSPADARIFFERFRAEMISQMELLQDGLSTKKLQNKLDKFIREIRDFEFNIPV